MYFHWRTDNSWQETFDVDARGDSAYEVLIIDGIQDSKEIEFPVIEDLCYHDVVIKKRGRIGGILRKGTAFIITSNLSPVDLFGHNAGIITARSMVIDSTGVHLFHLINHIREVHNLPPHEEEVLDIPVDYVGH